MSEPKHEPIPLKEPILIKRYSVAARVHHWFTALTAILLALSGLAFFHPSLFFLTDLFGGPITLRTATGEHAIARDLAATIAVAAAPGDHAGS